MEEHPIRTATWADEDRLGALFALSFAADPFVRWLLPDPLDFIADCNRHPRRAYAAAFDAGSIYILGDFFGAALWLPPGTAMERGEEVEANNGLLPAFPAEFPELVKKSAQYKPAEDHWYLGMLAVDPAHRGKGLGAALMEPSLSQCDRDGLPAYLESTSPLNLSLYQRFGFELLAEVQVGQSPARYPMLRPAQK